MNLYIFSSTSEINVMRGVRKKMWGVPASDNPFGFGRETKSHGLHVGSRGLFYCEGRFCAPFITLSEPDGMHIERGIWKGEYTLTFKIDPLGDYLPSVSKDVIESELPSLKQSGKSWDKEFAFRGIQAFVPTQITEDDWAYFVNRLSSVKPK